METTRAERRAHARRVGARRFALWKKTLGVEAALQRQCSPGRFRKVAPLGCNCRGRQKGNSKYGGGFCHAYRREVVEERIAWRAEAWRWLHQEGDADDRG